MSVWAWCRQLEDKFEQNNHVNLRSVLSQYQGPVDTNHVLTSIKDEMAFSTSQAVMLKQSDDSDQQLPRIPITAIFYRNDSAAKGVPHSFVTFLRRYPALPQVVVSASSVRVGQS
jgi:KUP system potassium uptake protein